MRTLYLPSTLRRVLPFIALLLISWTSMAQVPTISSFTPTSGSKGTIVTITGTNFESQVNQNTVYFGAVQGAVHTASPTELTVSVPTGATFSNISVTSTLTGLTAYSTKPFIVTFIGSGTINSSSFAPKVDFSTGFASSPYTVTIGDLDLDGDADIAVSNHQIANIALFTNTPTFNVIDGSSFAAAFNVTSGDVTDNLVIMDLDGDSHNDITTYNSPALKVSLYKNISGPGSFNPANITRVDLPATRNGPGVAVNDLDADGKPDVIALINDGFFNDYFISIYKNNNSQGTLSTAGFAAPVNTTTLPGGFDIAAVDIDGDGKPDLVALTGNEISIFRNISTAGTIDASSFASAVTFPATNNHYGIAIGDLDADGKSDIAVANGINNSVSVFRNNSTPGVISLQPKVDYPGGQYINDVAIGDLDGDGKLDLAFVNVNDATFSVLRNQSTPGMINAGSFGGDVSFTTGSNPYAIAIGDLDLDGRPEVVVANSQSNTISVFKNTNKPLPPIITSFSPTSGPIGTTVSVIGSNFSANPSDNIVYFGAVQATVLAADPNELTVKVNAGTTFQPITETVNELTAYGPTGFTTTFTSSGVIDATTFGTQISLAANGTPLNVVLGDLNLDGKADIVSVQDNPDGTIGVIKNNSSSALNFSTISKFLAHIDHPADPPDFPAFSDNFPTSLALGDFNGDGKLDVATPNGFSTSIGILPNISIGSTISLDDLQIFFSNDDGQAIAIGDLDGNGKPDVAVPTPSHHSAAMLLNQSDGSTLNFPSYDNTSITYQGHDMVLSDLDEDGIPDVITADDIYGINILRGLTMQGDIATTFDPPIDLTAGVLMIGVAVADMDNDGRKDIIATDNSDKKVYIFKNTFSGFGISFAAPVSFGVGNYPLKIAIGDLNGDGFLDIVVTNSGDNTISVLKNNKTGNITPGSFAAEVTFATGDGASGIAIGDLDGDGDPEIVVANNGDSHDLSVFNNLLINSGPPPGTITITLQPTDTGVCEGGKAVLKTNASGTTNITYQWQIAGNISGPYNNISNTPVFSGANTNTISVTTTVGFNFGAGFYRCVINGDSAPSVTTNSVELTINTLPTAPDVGDNFSCGPGAVTLNAFGTSNGNYRWYTTSTGGAPIVGAVNDTYTTPVLSTATNYYVVIYDGSCESTRAVVTADIETLPSPPVTTGAVSCTPAALSLHASGASDGQYAWYQVATAGTPIPGENNSVYTTGTVSSSTTFFVSLTNGNCESVRSPVIATIDVVAKPIIAASGCTATSVKLAGPTGFTSYAWSNGATGQQITLTTAGTITLSVKDSNGCNSPISDAVTYTSSFCNAPPAITTAAINATVDGIATFSLINLLSDPDGNLDLSTLKIFKHPNSGAIASIDAQHILTLDYRGKLFAGRDELTIEVCDIDQFCIQQVLSVEVIADIIVYTGISPNGNNQNDTWIIKYINLLDDTRQNHVAVYNRWGDAVFETDNYDNTGHVFTGLNKNGNELPTGTYFYKIDFASGRKTLTGYLSLKR